MTTNQDRAAFEKYIDSCIESNYGFLKAVEKDEEGDYPTSWVQGRWLAWQAALQSQQAHTDHPMRHYDRTCPACTAAQPVGKVLEVANGGSFKVEFFKSLPTGTLLYSTPPAAAEPVAWMHTNMSDCYAGANQDYTGYTIPLYRTPPATQSAWQPIATAPKDGTPMLVYHSRMLLEAWYSAIWDKFVVSESGGTNNIVPTHWMPLPNPPEAV